jgi:hypothetical protein
LVNAPSDRQAPPFLAGFRQASRHVQVIQAVIAGIRAQAAVPVWLVGTSRGTQSAAFIATELAGPEGSGGLVLTASILTDSKSTALSSLMDRLTRAPHKAVLT